MVIQSVIRYLKWLIWGILLLFSGLSRTENMSVRYQQNSTDIRYLPENDVIDIPAGKPDTTALWYYIREKKRSFAKEETKHLKMLYPGWQPDEKMKKALAELFRKKSRQEIAFSRVSQISEENWPEITSGNAALASAYALRSGTAADNSLMGWILIQKKAFSTALRHFKRSRQKQLARSHPDDEAMESEAMDKVADGIQVALRGLVYQAIQAGDKQQLNHLTEQYPDQPVHQFIDDRAWEYFDQEAYLQALPWFEFSGDIFARVITLKKLEREQEAGALACAHLSVEEMPDFCADSYALQQAALFDQEQYQASLQAAEKIAEIRPLEDDQLKLVAWAHFHLGDKKESIAAFRLLLASEPDNEDYAGILVLLLEPDSPVLKQLAGQYPLIAEKIKTAALQRASQHKQFDRYYQLEHPADHRLVMETGTSWRGVNSDEALGSSNTNTHYISISADRDFYRFGARIHYRNIKSDIPGTGQWYGLQPLTEPFSADRTAGKTGFSTYLQHQSENRNLLAGLSYQPATDGFAADLSGKIAMVWFHPESTLAATLYRAPVTDSLLSSSGMVDQSSQRWGAVHANGLKSILSRTIDPAWSATSEIDLAWLEGERVKDNRKLNLTLSLTREMAAQNHAFLDYFRITPFLSWLSYDHNQNSYSVGNGGYFSPETFLSTGSRVSLLTTENQQWQMKAEMSLSYRYSDPGPLNRLPYSGSGISGPQSTDTGVDASARLEGQYRFSPHWTLAGLASFSHGDDYHETLLGIQLRWNFSAKNDVTSDTFITSSPYRTDYAW